MFGTRGAAWACRISSSQVPARAPSVWSAGTTLTRDQILLPLALRRMRPVSNRSRERFSPICRVRKTETIAGRNPIFTLCTEFRFRRQA